MNEKATPLLEVHKQLKARMAGFGGWLMPIQYEGIIAEHVWTRNSASLFDICHMGEFKIKGNPLKVNLEKILTFNLSQMPELSCRYGFMLNDRAGVIVDVVIVQSNRVLAFKITPNGNIIKWNVSGQAKDLVNSYCEYMKGVKDESIRGSQNKSEGEKTE